MYYICNITSQIIISLYSVKRPLTWFVNLFWADIRHKNAEISTGLELNDLSVAGFICGRFGAVKAVDMHNRIARYVKLELIYGGNFINLCEMQVFGHLGMTLINLYLAYQWKSIFADNNVFWQVNRWNSFYNYSTAFWNNQFIMIY